MNHPELSLELRSVALQRAGQQLVSDLSFRLAAGQLALVTGPNGSGKTTLLRTLAGLAPPDSGEILIHGKPLAQLESDDKKSIVYHGHLDGLKKDLTIQENIRFIRELRDSTQSISEAIAEVGLVGFEDRSVRHLSAGQKRRAALAALKTSDAGIWLLDEPLTNLDSAGRGLIPKWLDSHLSGGGIAVVATHLTEELARPGSLLVEL